MARRHADNFQICSGSRFWPFALGSAHEGLWTVLPARPRLRVHRRTLDRARPARTDPRQHPFQRYPPRRAAHVAYTAVAASEDAARGGAGHPPQQRRTRGVPADRSRHSAGAHHREPRGLEQALASGDAERRPRRPRSGDPGHAPKDEPAAPARWPHRDPVRLHRPARGPAAALDRLPDRRRHGRGGHLPHRSRLRGRSLCRHCQPHRDAGLVRRRADRPRPASGPHRPARSAPPARCLSVVAQFNMLAGVDRKTPVRNAAPTNATAAR